MSIKTCFLVLLCIQITLFGQNRLTFEEILTTVLENNLQLQAERQKLKIASAEKTIGVSPDNPAIFIERGEISNGVSNDQALGIAQSIEFPSVYFHRSKLFNWQIKVLEQKSELLKAGVFLEVYFKALEYLILEKRTDFLRQNRDLLQKVFEQNQKRFQAGEVNKLIFLKSQVSFRTITTELENLELEKAKTLKELQTLLNSPDPIIPDDTVAADTTIVYSDSRNAFIRSHPQTLLKEFEIQKLRSEKSLAYSTFLPAFNIAVKDQKVEGLNLWGFEVGFSIPLWFGKQLGSVKLAKHNLLKSEIEQQFVEQQLGIEFENYWNEYLQAKNKLLLFQKQLLPEAEEIYFVAEKSYQEGEISYLNFVDSYRIKLDTESNYLNVLQALNRAAAKLHKFRLQEYLSK